MVSGNFVFNVEWNKLVYCSMFIYNNKCWLYFYIIYNYLLFICVVFNCCLLILFKKKKDKIIRNCIYVVENIVLNKICFCIFYFKIF